MAGVALNFVLPGATALMTARGTTLENEAHR